MLMPASTRAAVDAAVEAETHEGTGDQTAPRGSQTAKWIFEGQSSSSRRSASVRLSRRMWTGAQLAHLSQEGSQRQEGWQGDREQDEQ